MREGAGSCSLKLHASGKWVEENDFAIDISPNKVRDMFSRVMEKCVQGTGGFVTQGLNNTISWITREDTEFPGEPPKVRGQPRNLYIRKDSPRNSLWKMETPKVKVRRNRGLLWLTFHYLP